MNMTGRLILALLVAALSCIQVSWAQQPPTGMAPCSAHTLSVSGSSGNVQLSGCGPSVILYNISSQELFYNIGSASNTAATTSNYSLPGNTSVTLTVPNPTPNAAGWYVAAITSTSTTTLRIVEGLSN
jgi:hypothetical protein